MIPNTQSYSPPVLPLPPLPDDIVRTIHKFVDERLDVVMEGKDEKLNKQFEKYICDTVNDYLKKHGFSNNKTEEEVHISHKKSPMEALYCKLHHYQKEVYEGKPLMEVEKEIYSNYDFSNEQKRVFSSLIRADSPYSLSSMIGMNYDDYISHMEHLGERFLED